MDFTVCKVLTFCRHKYILFVATKNEVMNMSPTLGRPKSESPKDTMLRVRLDDAYCQKLEQCAAKLNVSKSDVVRKGIDLVEKSIEKK